ncbi:DUF2867 domain-containing protein [Pseudomonas asplenii]|uniref:DUF2867 domain-containing protein n=1 Tax=Pseudomonas asplenii TaxID=53407 RepID=UPI000372B5E5|nr:DUF2867 domain-containing protein [Pseudomonas fuscovaginae]
MKPSVHPCPVPPDSSINRFLPNADFIDSQCISDDRLDRTALRHALNMMSTTPAWIDGLMQLRNRIVGLFGLKDLGRLTRIDLSRADADYRENDRVGIFTLISNQPDEVMLADCDKHLDVYLTLHRSPVTAQRTRTLTLSTVVHTHNLLGRLYMLPVAPFHRLIVPITLRNASRH